MTRRIFSAFLVGMVVGAIILGGIWISNSARHNSDAVLVRACVPMDTGGGVVQCAQPSKVDTAIMACFANSAPYIGANMADTFHMMRQCITDYNDR